MKKCAPLFCFSHLLALEITSETLHITAAIQCLKKMLFEKNCYLCLVHVKLAGYRDVFEASLQDKGPHPGNSSEP